MFFLIYKKILIKYKKHDFLYDSNFISKTSDNSSIARSNQIQVKFFYFFKETFIYSYCEKNLKIPAFLFLKKKKKGFLFLKWKEKKSQKNFLKNTFFLKIDSNIVYILKNGKLLLSDDFKNEKNNHSVEGKRLYKKKYIEAEEKNFFFFKKIQKDSIVQGGHFTNYALPQNFFP